ncbi:hypothetical protein ABPG74_020638, partial [Tetrahymena malaccensis]
MPEIKLDNDVSIQKEKLDLSEQKEEGDYFKNRRYQSRVVKTKLQIDFQQIKQSFKERLTNDHLKSQLINTPRDANTPVNRAKLDKHIHNFKAIQNKQYSQIIYQNIFKTRFRRKEEYLQNQGLSIKLVEYEPDSTKGQQIVDKKNCKDQKSENEYNEFAEQIQIFKENQYESQQIKTKQQVDLNQIKTDLKYTFFKERLTIQTPRSPQQAFLKKQSF